MQELLTQYPIVLAVMLGLALAEWLWARFGAKRSYDVGSSLASFGVAIVQSLLKPLGGTVILGTYLTLYEITPLRLPMDDWRAWVAGFFAVEFAYYWFHRFSHRINWLWATHAVHHSANELTLPAAVRLGWTGVISGGWLIFAPLILLGCPPQMVGLLLAINLLYQFGLHTEAIRKLGPLEWALNTPSHHRAHHASEGPWLDCNFGGVLIIFDRMFGTFVPEPAEGGQRYGLTDPIASNNPFIIALRQWAIMANIFGHASNNRDRWRVIAGRPAELIEIERRQSAHHNKRSHIASVNERKVLGGNLAAFGGSDLGKFALQAQHVASLHTGANAVVWSRSDFGLTETVFSHHKTKPPQRGLWS